MEQLQPVYDSRASFYGKAQVGENSLMGKGLWLKSYDTFVARIVDGMPEVYGMYSATTTRHIKEFLKQNGFRADTSKQVMQDFGKEQK